MAKGNKGNTKPREYFVGEKKLRLAMLLPEDDAPRTLANTERREIIFALCQYGTLKRAAAALGCSTRKIQYRLNAWGWRG